MIKRIALAAAAVAAIAAAAGVCVVSLAYAIFALARIWLTAPAAAAVVTLVFAIAIGIAALLLGRKGHRKQLTPEPGPIERLTQLARQKPLLAAGLAVVGTFMAIRNPAMVTTLAMGMLAPKPNPRR